MDVDSLIYKNGAMYETDELTKLTEEGRHEVSFTYSGASLVSESGKPLDLVSVADAVVVIDRTAPKLAGASIKDGFDSDSEVAQMPGSNGKLISEFCLAASARFPFSLWMRPARRASRLLAWSSLRSPSFVMTTSMPPIRAKGKSTLKTA